MARRSRSTLALVALLAATLGALAVWFTWFAGAAADPSATARSASGGLERRDTRRDDLAAASSGARSGASHTEQPAAPSDSSHVASAALPHPGHGSIEGTLISAGVPAADWIVVAHLHSNLAVFLDRADVTERHVVHTDSRGRFTFSNLASGRYVLLVEGPSDRSTSALSPWLRLLRPKLVDVPPDGATEVALELGGGSTTIHGHFVDPFGSPIDGREVQLVSRQPSGPYDFIDVGPRESETERRLRGLVPTYVLGDPFVEACLSERIPVAIRTTTDVDGRFAFERVPPGFYEVFARPRPERSWPQPRQPSVHEAQFVVQRLVDTSLLADWDLGDIQWRLEKPVELSLTFVDAHGRVISGYDDHARAWCRVESGFGNASCPVLPSPQRLSLDMRHPAHGRDPFLLEIVVSKDREQIAAQAHDLRDTPLQDGRRVYEATVTLP